MNGYWYVFILIDGVEKLVGSIEATSEGWDEMGCDLYARLYEAELITDPELLEAAEADTDKTIALIYKHGIRNRATGSSSPDCRVYYSDHDITDDTDIDYDGEKCQRYMDFHGIRDDRNGWQCCNDQTGCMYNDGGNTCLEWGISKSPVED